MIFIPYKCAPTIIVDQIYETNFKFLLNNLELIYIENGTIKPLANIGMYV
jgi:hypothetical protein